MHFGSLFTGVHRSVSNLRPLPKVWAVHERSGCVAGHGDTEPEIHPHVILSDPRFTCEETDEATYPGPHSK